MSATKLAWVVLVGLPVVGLAQNEGQAENPGLAEQESSSSCINHIVFSQEFLSRYPQAGGACREVKVKDGQKWARFDADVIRVRGNRVTANFVDRSDRSLGTITFDAARSARVNVDGREKRFSALRPRDKLSFWMPESSAGFYAEPGASESTKLAVVETGPPRG